MSIQDYSTITPLLAKRNMFYDACNNLAESIVEELQEHKQLEQLIKYEDELNDYVIEYIGQDIYGSQEAYVEDLLNSYGITRAIMEFNQAGGKDYMEDRPENQYVYALLHEAMGKPVFERVKSLLENH